MVARWLNAPTPVQMNASKAYEKNSKLVKPCRFAPILPAVNSGSVVCITIPVVTMATTKHFAANDTPVPVKFNLFKWSLPPIVENDTIASPLQSCAFSCPSYNATRLSEEVGDFSFFTSSTDFGINERCLCVGCMPSFHGYENTDRMQCLGIVSPPGSNVLYTKLPEMTFKMSRLAKNAEPRLSKKAKQQPLQRSAFSSFSKNVVAEILPSYFDTYYGPLSDNYARLNAVLNARLGGSTAMLKMQQTGDTIVHDAAKEGDLNKIAFLLKEGMLPAARNFRDETPSFCAAIMGFPSAALLLQLCSRH